MFVLQKISDVDESLMFMQACIFILFNTRTIAGCHVILTLI